MITHVFPLVVFSTVLICYQTFSPKEQSHETTKLQGIGNILFGETVYKPSICTQFVMTMSCTMSKVKGPVCRRKLVLLYLCSLLLANSYAPEPNPGNPDINWYYFTFVAFSWLILMRRSLTQDPVHPNILVVTVRRQ